MDRKSRPSSLALLMLCGGATLALAQGVSFADLPVGTSPKNFEAMQTGSGEPSRWEMIADAETTSGRAVAQLSEDPTDGRFPLLIRMETAPADVSVRTRVRPVSGQVDQAGGLVVRLLDPNNYYVVRANALEGNVRFYKVIGGRRQQLAGADLAVAGDAWHTLRLDAQGDRFTVWFDGQELFTTVDTAITTPGKVAFWTKADSVTRFDGLDIRPPP